MNRLITISLAFLLPVLSAFAQDTTAHKNKIKDSSIVVSRIGNETTIQIKNKEKGTKSDTTLIKLGKKSITIMENEEGTNIKVEDLDEQELESKKKYMKEEDEDDFDFDFDEEEFSFKKKTKKEFDGHWSGFEMGINNYVNRNYSMELSPQNAFMELNSSKSWNVNLNLLEYSLGLIGENFGFITGLGFEFNDYKFDGNNNLMENDNGQIVSKTDYDVENLTKSKISMSYLTVPALFEFQAPAGDKDAFFISAGIIGGLKLGSHTKVVYHKNGKQKIKEKDDFNLSPFRYGAAVRLGYKFVKLYANYYPVTLFEKNKGPELYPFSLGLILVSF